MALKVFRGVIAIKTRDKQLFEWFYYKIILQDMSVINPQLDKVYFKPDYSQE